MAAAPLPPSSPAGSDYRTQKISLFGAFDKALQGALEEPNPRPGKALGSDDQMQYDVANLRLVAPIRRPHFSHNISVLNFGALR